MDAALPQNLAEAHALIERLTASLAEKDAALSHRDEEIERLERILDKYIRRQYGKTSEQLPPEQMALGLEDLETGIAAAKAKAESQDATRVRRHGVKRGDLPDHLPRVEIVIEPENQICPCCGGALHVIGEDKSERLDVIPAQHRVLVTRQAEISLPFVSRGRPLRHRRRRISSKLAYPPRRCWPMSWSANMPTICRCIASTRSCSARGIRIDRSCLADWVGRSAFALRPIVARMLELLKRSTKLFCDLEQTVPVLDPGRGKTKTGYLWAIARDDRPWNGPDPPGVVYVYAPGRAGEYARQALRGFKGVLQVDGYTGYNALTDGRRKEDPLDLAFCWAHWRRDFFDINKGGSAPIAAEVLNRIAALYQIKNFTPWSECRGTSCRASGQDRATHRRSVPLAGAEAAAPAPERQNGRNHPLRPQAP